jgi:hypothetical protein
MCMHVTQGGGAGTHGPCALPGPGLVLDGGVYARGVLSALAGLWQVAGYLLAVLMWADTPQRAAVLTIAVLAVILAGCLVASASLAGAAAGLPVLRRATALREKSWRVAFLRQRDPNARGRTRPRAPAAAPAAA